MPSVLITGANRGIGLEFARQYSAEGWGVIATVRESSAELDALGVRVESLELADLDSVSAFGERIHGPLDLLIANAGTMKPQEARSGEDGRAWAEVLVVNSIAPYLLARACLDRVGEAKGKIVAISSGMGSISDNGSGGYVPYRNLQSGAEHGLAQPGARLQAARDRRGGSQPRLGQDPHGRTERSKVAERQRREHAQDDRNARPAAVGRLLQLRWAALSLVVCPGSDSHEGTREK